MTDINKLFSRKDLADIEEWRSIDKPSKFQCAWMQKFKNRILKDRKQAQEKTACFCAQPDRLEYRRSFYPFWDEYKKTCDGQIDTAA